jgi:hypothetical protein
MQSPNAYLLAFALAIGLLITGAVFVRNPGKMYRIFSFGQAESQLGVKFIRVVGWFYICGGAIGVLMLIAAVALNYSRSH